MKPTKVSDLEMAFPANVLHMMPAYKDIPEEFKRGNTPQNKLIQKLFYEGGQVSWLITKPGIEKRDALRTISCILSSFEPKHEHKEAGTAILLAEWFEPFTDQDIEQA